MTEGQTPVEVFCSYAHEDEMWLRKLETHLSLLKRQGLISFWHDRLIAPGTNWAKAVDVHLETASVILLLVSADFLASDYCYGVEMKRALERGVAGEARVVPILVRKADWTDAPFAHLQVLPTDAKAIASWPNKDTALADVAAGIRRVIVEELPHLTASVPRAALPKIWDVPYPRNPFFLGRENELLRIRQNLQAGQTTDLSQPQAISGLGGIGKTQLALEYAYRYHQDYTAVLWVRAESTEALISSYVALATLLRLPESKAKEQEVIVQAVKTWLQMHRGWLLILDNADDLALLPDFLPPVSAGHLLLTTRAVATGRLAHQLEIETLLLEQGALFLLRRSALLAPDAELSDVSHQEKHLAMQISEELGGLPLALDQAGAYLEETGCSLADYQQLYWQHRDALLRKRGGLVADHPESVATTWSLSFQRIEEKNPAATDLLRLCAFLAPDAIAEEILTAGASTFGPTLGPVVADAFRLNQVIEALRSYSLVRRNSREKILSVHRLVQAVLQDQQTEAERRTWVERAVRAIDAAFPHAEFEMWPQCERLLPQALAAAECIRQDQMMFEEAGRLLSGAAWYLRQRARYREAEPLYQQALSIREQQLGPQHLDVAKSCNGLANLYWQQGKYTEAEPLYQQALSIWEQQLGPQHLQVASPLNNLATLYYSQGKYIKAEPLYQQALSIWEQQLGPDHLQVAYSLNNLAIIYSEQGKYTEAELLYQRALHIREQQLGPDHPDMAYPLNGLAVLYHEQGKYTEAELLYQRALHICERQLGSDHPEVASPLTNLGNLYSEQGKYAEAEPLYQRALHIRQQQLGPDHPQVSSPLNGLAKLYREQGEYAQAEPLFQRALHIREQQLGPQHPDTAETIHDLAQFREAQGNSEKAKILFARALAVREKALGRHHPKTTETRTHLLTLLHTMGQHEEAVQLENEGIQAEP